MPRAREATQRILVPAIVGALLVIASEVVCNRLLHSYGRGLTSWGFDFRGGLWPAASRLLNGTTPFAPAQAKTLFDLKTSFVTPPILAIVAIPLAHLPFGAAIAIWNCLSLLCLAAALWIVGLRDWRMYALAVASYPMVNTLLTGQSDALFALLLALAWRYRDDPRGPIAAGALIALKLLAWPLVLWFLFTRRWRSAIGATGIAGFLLLAGWAFIDFKGILQYPQLLAADAKAFEAWTYSLSLVGAGIHLGLAPGAATGVAMVAGAGLGAAIVRAGRGSDVGWFAGATTAGLLMSPLVWPHYLVILFVPLAIARPRSVAPWLVSILMWASIASGDYGLDIGLTLAGAVVMLVWACRKPRPVSVATSHADLLAKRRLHPGELEPEAPVFAGLAEAAGVP